MVTAAYDRLTARFARIATVGEAIAMLGWDASVLMDGFQRGVRAADVEPIFADYATFLADALPRAEAIQAARGKGVPLQGPFPVGLQEALCRRLSAAAGLDYSHARLDR